MDIKLTKQTYFVSEGDEKVIIEQYSDGRIETINIRLLAKSDLIERAIKMIV